MNSNCVHFIEKKFLEEHEIQTLNKTVFCSNIQSIKRNYENVRQNMYLAT